ncbi:MAG TPA: Nudix family hydrolase [Sulfuricaulis sp.]|nr:Nudix family hydrolase [Sulfuricaulis sp.]
MNAAAEHRPALDVAVAIIQRADGHVLLAQRPTGKPWEGYWEFPGGKIESGEDAKRALARELHEELGVETDRVYPWVTQEYAYPEKKVRLHFFRVTEWHGQPHGREGQHMSWEDPAAINIGPLLPANDRILRALCLPSIYAISNVTKYGDTEFLQRLKVALDKGVRLIQLREPEMSPEQLESLARRVVRLVHEHDARVLINSDATLARRVGADGVHLTSRQLLQTRERPSTEWWAASCHNVAELAQAAALGADFVVLSPVLPTPSHPEEKGLGWDNFASLVSNYPVPVYALGGMKLELLVTAMQYGAHGVSLLRKIW